MENQIKIKHGSGATYAAKSTNLTGAKREATKSMTYGGGSVYVCMPDGVVYGRLFWSSLNRFGWSKWQLINSIIP